MSLLVPDAAPLAQPGAGQPSSVLKLRPGRAPQIFADSLPGLGLTVALDNYYNNECRPDPTGEPVSYHYTWEDTTNSGFSQLGSIIRRLGYRITTHSGPPSRRALDSCALFIIVDPDTPKETASPHTMTSADADTLERWVHAGGILLIFANDSGNCDLSHLNILTQRFGIRLNEDSHHRVKGTAYETGATERFPAHPLFAGVRKIFTKEVASMTLVPPAETLLADGDFVLMATARVGRGLVFAIGDPWLYNEYMDHRRLPEEFDNARAASNLFRWLAGEVQDDEGRHRSAEVDHSAFHDSEHHWYDVRDEDRVVEPVSEQQRYDESDIAAIAGNMLLYQKVNGGWPKNYDMRAVLTERQKEALRASAGVLNTTFDNGATHSQVEFLAKASASEGDPRFRDASLRGLDFMLDAQYPNGGWPQYFPDTSGYRKYITYNDGAMIGVMKVLQQVLRNEPWFAFVDADRRARVRDAFAKGLKCILRTQVRDGSVLTVWCQQHDNNDLTPRPARSFEPAAWCSQESAQIVLFLMSLDEPAHEAFAAVEGAVRWFTRMALRGIAVRTVDAPPEEYRYHSTREDKIVVEDPDAPPIWARFYEFGTERPLFSTRDGVRVYTLAEVERERRTGYAWYTDDPARVLRRHASWAKKWTRRLHDTPNAISPKEEK